MMLHILPWQWVLLAVSAAALGFSKTGVAGLGVVAVAAFAVTLPGKQSVGALLPILICGDIVAVASYRRHAVWWHLWRLFPFAAAGIIAGYFAMGRFNDAQVSHLIGAILVTLVLLQLWRRRAGSAAGKDASADPGSAAVASADAGINTAGVEAGPMEDRGSFWFAASLGILAGFTTMVANAAGPIVILYMLAMGLPKMEFIGTSAWYFLVLNLFKVPFNASLGLITGASLALDVRIAPFAILGAVAGRLLIRYIDQKVFENLALVFTAAAGIKLLL